MISSSLIVIVGVIALGVYSLIQLQKNFSERLFFKIGMFLFLIQAVASTYGIYAEWSLLPFWAIISKIGSTLFSYVLAYFFYWLMDNAPAKMGGAGTQLSPDEIHNFLKEDIKENEGK